MRRMSSLKLFKDIFKDKKNAINDLSLEESDEEDNHNHWHKLYHNWQYLKPRFDIRFNRYISFIRSFRLKLNSKFNKGKRETSNYNNNLECNSDSDSNLEESSPFKPKLIDDRGCKSIFLSQSTDKLKGCLTNNDLMDKEENPSNLLEINVRDENMSNISHTCFTNNQTSQGPAFELSAGNTSLQQFEELDKHGWYWGPLSRSEAEDKLRHYRDGAFLVRDSSDQKYLFSLSFRSYSRTFHTRIEYTNGLFSFYSYPEPESFTSVKQLIEESIRKSQYGIVCCSTGRSSSSHAFPVRLTYPVSRFSQVLKLQDLCRFRIEQLTRSRYF